ERGAGHGDRAEMPCFQLGHQEKACGANLMAPPDFGLAVLPYRRMKTERDRAAHQRMIGRMIFDQVYAPSLPVMGSQTRYFGVRQTGEILGLMRQHEPANAVEILAH